MRHNWDQRTNGCTTLCGIGPGPDEEAHIAGDCPWCAAVSEGPRPVPDPAILTLRAAVRRWARSGPATTEAEQLQRAARANMTVESMRRARSSAVVGLWPYFDAQIAEAERVAAAQRIAAPPGSTSRPSSGVAGSTRQR